jgi:hypothetical protein
MKTILVIAIVVIIQVLVMELVRMLTEWRKERAARLEQLHSRQQANQEVCRNLTVSYLESINR